MTLESLRALQTRVRDCKGPDRELDGAIADAFGLPSRTALQSEITKLKSQLEDARARINELETGFSTVLAEVKDELNGLAMMGAVPMWGSLIGRLDDLAVDVLNPTEASNKGGE